MQQTTSGAAGSVAAFVVNSEPHTGARSSVRLWRFARAMDPQPTGLSVPAFTAPTLLIALGVLYRRHRKAGQGSVTGYGGTVDGRWRACGGRRPNGG
jgi:hypothetical protein